MRYSRLLAIAFICGFLGALISFGVTAVLDNDDSNRSDLPANEWCIEEIWDEGLAPADFTKVDLIDDCTDALEGGLNRPIVREMYTNIKEEGG